MTALQYRMLELVLEIDEICKRHGIVYYLAGGSVLGAVRHKGFIPWDDDIDIMMTRQEFAKFQKACQIDMADDREIITQVNTPCHTKVTIKYMNKSTSQFFRSQVLDTTGCGISLDIMILDPLPRDEAEKEQHIAEYIVYNELLTPFFMVNKFLYKHVPLYNRLHKKAKRIGKEKVMDELYRHLFVDEPKESDLYLYRWGQQLLIYDRQLFGTPRYLDFEGYQLPVPEKTIDFLRATYGDGWIYLPPEGQRETHTSNMNPNIPYCNWLRDIKPFLNRSVVLNNFVMRKKYNVKKAVPAHQMELYNHRQAALMLELEFEMAPGRSLEAMAAMDDRALLQEVQGYLKYQLSAGFRRDQICVHIPDEKLALILNALIRAGDFAKAGKLLALRNTVDRKLTDELEEAQRFFESVRDTVRYFEDRRLDENDVAPITRMAPRLHELCQKHPGQIDLQRCLMELYTIIDDVPAEQLITAARRALDCWPDDPQIAFWAGCLYEKLGMTEDAAALYEKAKDTTNGILLQRLMEMEGNRND